MSLSGTCNWKHRPCHFTWKLNTGNRVNYDKIIRNIDSDLVITGNLATAGNLLFRSYLEVSNRNYHYDVSKALEFLDRADYYVTNQAPPDFRNGFKSVVLLNRMWIEHKNLNNKEVNSLLAKLNELDLTERDLCVINTLKATCLTRLGPPEFDNALKLFESALEHFPESSDFLFGAMLITGRKVRYNRKLGDDYHQLDYVGKSLMDKERSYCEKLIRVNDEYRLGRSFLGQNFNRRGINYHDSACFQLEKAYQEAPTVRAVFNNLIRYYRYHNELEKAIRALKDNIEKWPYDDVAESHFQLALCYIRQIDQASNKRELTQAALYHLDKCLNLDEMHLFSLTKKLDLLTKRGQLQDIEKARRLYQDRLQQSDILSPQDRFHLFYCYAKFLDCTKSSSMIEMWERVMDISTEMQYQDESSGEWKVADRIKVDRDRAYKKLITYYECTRRVEHKYLKLGNLYLQMFEFAKAEKALIRLDPRSNIEIPMNLAEIHFKWGCKLEVQSHLRQCQPHEAAVMFRRARENVLTASKMSDFDESRGRKLLADIALWTAHNRLTSESLETPRLQPTPPDSVNEPCIDAYREASRCGSLVASVELLRLIEKGHLKTISRSMYIRILAEIYMCCSRDASGSLHTEYKPLSFQGGLTSRDKDSDQMGMDCDTIKQDITDLLSQDEFYSDARKQYFDMERQILQEDPGSTSVKLMLSEAGGNAVKDCVLKAAVDCCEKARPLLDHIVVKFQMEELKFSEEKKKQYFPLKRETDRTKLEKEMKKPLKALFEVDLKTHYSKLYNYILQIQPGINPEYECLLSLCEVVGQSKHAGRTPEKLRSLVEDPVKMARQSMDKVEEICNFFRDTMEDVSQLDNKVKELVSDLRSGSHDQAAQLLGILTENHDYVCRIRSTWTILEMMALVQRSRNQDGPIGDPDGRVIRLVEGSWELCKKLRRSHLAVEAALLETADPSSNEVLDKCRDTCKETDGALKSVLETKKRNRQHGKVVEFPFKDLHPQGSDLGWEGKVSRQLKIDIKRMGITPDDNLIKSVLKLQPCTNEENYKFLAMQRFAQTDDGVEALKGTVSIQTDIPDTREYRVVDIVRWCTDKADEIAGEIYELTL
ncbi:uncharacterized protein [Asterias amurensis]|uniref:uncharacterized protein isoform X1 n=1 Tax=Asterias amurensis TaxID=7602 RepID=UPI003AB5E6B0